MPADLEIAFGHLGNGAAYKGDGFSTDEPHGVWLVDGQSTLSLPRPDRPGDYLLSLALGGLVAPGHEFQRLSIRVNGGLVCSEALRGDGVTECWVPWPLLDGQDPCQVVLSHPDGWSPSELGGDDRRLLSLYLRTLTLSLLTERASPIPPVPLPPPGPPPEPPPEPPAPPAPEPVPLDRLLLDFESLGPGSAFGLVQRHHGAEPLGLFRFAHAPPAAVAALLDALPDVFPGSLADPDALSLAPDPDTREYALLDATHGIAWHTGVREGQADPSALQRQWTARLPWLVHRLAEVLADGTRFLVLCDEAAPTPPEDVARLLAALRRHGPATLLWVGACGPDTPPPGEVAPAGDGLLRGWTDGSMPAWAALCRAAHRFRLALTPPS